MSDNGTFTWGGDNPDGRWLKQYEDIAINRNSKLAVEALRQHVVRNAPSYISALAKGAAEVAPALAPMARLAGPAAATASTAYGATRSAINRMPQQWQDNITDTVGGTINQGMQRIGMGTDDSAYLMQRAQEAARAQRPAQPSFGNVASGMNTQNQATPHVAAAPYQGTLNDQYSQALGQQPRYVSANPQSQALNDQYDRSFGYNGMQRKV